MGRRRADLLETDVVGQQLGEDAALAHPARDQLRVLASEVEDDDLFLMGPPPTHPRHALLRGIRGAVRPRPDGVHGPRDAERSEARTTRH